MSPSSPEISRAAPPTPGAATLAPRQPGLDAARAVAVMAMVLGHTADSLLAPLYKEGALFQTYTTFRGMTAPLFLFVAGWAVGVRAVRAELFGAALARKHFARAAVLLAWGLFLRWPAWDVPGLVAGKPDLWQHWLGMDALACIALCLALSVPPLWPRLGARVRSALVASIASLAVFCAREVSAGIWSLPWSAWLAPSSETPFPLLPWSGHFFVGAAAGTLLCSLRERKAQALVLLGFGALGLAGSWALGLDRLPLWSPTLFLYRVSFAAAVGGFAVVLPPRVTGRLGPVGRASLTVYLFHLPLLYGWGSFGGLHGVLGATLTPWQVGVLATLGVVLGTLLADLKKHPLAPLRWGRSARPSNARIP